MKQEKRGCRNGNEERRRRRRKKKRRERRGEKEQLEESGGTERKEKDVRTGETFIRRWEQEEHMLDGWIGGGQKKDRRR